MNRTTKLSPATMAKIGLLAAIGFILMFFEFQLPIFPEFIKLDLSELPVIVGAMALGPVAGVLIELIKNLLDLTKTTTGGIGQIANFIIGSAYIVPIGLVYKKSRNVYGYILGAVLGIILMVCVSCLMNYFVLFPMYTKFMPIELIINMAQAVNSRVFDLKTLIFYTMVPFNVIKGTGITILGYFLFKALQPLLIRTANTTK